MFRTLIFGLVLSTGTVTGDTIRVAAFNIASGLTSAGELTEKLRSKNDLRLQRIAAIIQHMRPDILLLNEFDYSAEADHASLFKQHYLAIGQFDQQPVDYPYFWSDVVNTGIDSGLDLNNDGKTGGPADAWGFGHFPGQYGMLVLSRFPLDSKNIRSFRKLRWASMPDALRPKDPVSGEYWHPDSVWKQLRLSSKSHWDIPVKTPIGTVHFLVTHPVPPVFDGPEDRNGHRNHDEIRLFADYIQAAMSGWIVDDNGLTGGLTENTLFVIAGDLNADPLDGDSYPGSIDQLLQSPRINSRCIPASTGAIEDSLKQAGQNTGHKGNPAADTGRFDPRGAGNLRLDYVLPAADLQSVACGVFWPAEGEPGSDWLGASDHRLVWLDITLPGS